MPAIMLFMARNPENKYSERQSARLLNISAIRSLEVLELIHKNRMVNGGRSLKAPQWSLNKESIVVNEVSSLINDEKRIY